MYDRFDDWYCYYYDGGLKQWMWDDKRSVRDADRVRKEKIPMPPPTPATSGRDQKREGVMGDDKTSPKQKKKPVSGRSLCDDGWTTVAPSQDARSARVSTTTVFQRKK